jgi:2-oxoglutarate dehydrogenase E2 component (dihydrolipoamide succinyltransferase)
MTECSTNRNDVIEEQMVQVPQMAESISEGTLKQFSKKVGDYVELDEEIATIETDKIDVSVNAPAAGTIKELLANEEDTVTVGQDLVRLELGGAPSKSSEPKEEKKEESKPEPKKEEPKKEESKPEPKKEESKPEPKKESKPAPKKDEPKKVDAIQKESESSSKEKGPYGNREERRVKMNRMRLRIAERLKQSQNTAASLTTFNEVDMSALMEMRKLYKDEILKKTGIKFGFMSAFTRASILAMRDIPAVNASIEGPGSGDTIVYRDYVDVSVAVATEKGLVTPVVRNAEALDLIGIESGIAELGKKVGNHRIRFATEGIANIGYYRLVITSSPSRTWPAAPSPSATAVSSALSWAHPSSTCHRPPSSACTPSRRSPSPSTARSRSAL